MQIGIIGGTGIDDPNILEHRTEKKVTTPFGEVSIVRVNPFTAKAVWQFCDSSRQETLAVARICHNTLGGSHGGSVLRKPSSCGIYSHKQHIQCLALLFTL